MPAIWAQVAAVIVLEVNCLEQTIAHQQIVQWGFLWRIAEWLAVSPPPASIKDSQQGNVDTPD